MDGHLFTPCVRPAQRRRGIVEADAGKAAKWAGGTKADLASRVAAHRVVRELGWQVLISGCCVL
jgi:hypothetical protein